MILSSLTLEPEILTQREVRSILGGGDGSGYYDGGYIDVEGYGVDGDGYQSRTGGGQSGGGDYSDPRS